MSIYALDEINPEDVSTATDMAGPLFDIVQNVFILIGVILLIIVVFRVAKLFAKGDMSGVAKTALGGLVAAILCFNLNLPVRLVSEAGNFAGNIFESIGKVADSGDGTGTSTDPGTGTGTDPDSTD